MFVSAAKSNLFNGNDPPRRFKFLGYGLVDSQDEMPVKVQDSEPLEEMANICLQVGGRAFDSTGRIFCRIDREVIVTKEEDLVSITLPRVFELDDQPPWHLVDVFLKGLPNPPLQTMTMDVTFDSDVSDLVNLYLCFFGGNSNRAPFYGGFQTNVGCPDQGESQPAVLGDYGLIFSRWGPANLGDCIKANDSCFMEAGGYEGNFVSVRSHLKWRKGCYRICLSVENDGEWVNYEVLKLNEETKTVTSRVPVGSLKFRQSGKEPLKLGSFLYQFVEIYGPDNPLLSTIPEFSFVVDNLRLNGEESVPQTSEAIYYKHCPRYVQVAQVDGKDDWHLKYTVGGRVGPTRSTNVQITRK